MKKSRTTGTTATGGGVGTAGTAGTAGKEGTDGTEGTAGKERTDGEAVVCSGVEEGAASSGVVAAPGMNASYYNPFMHPLYACITICAPMYTCYTCIYTLYTPNAPLNTLS